MASNANILMSRRTDLIIYNKEVGIPIESSGHTNYTNKIVFV
jgi:hypothetical protein